jgi:hypothetical protein
MTFQQKLMIMAACAAAVATALLAATSSKPTHVTSRFGALIALWLLVVSGALVAVGIVSQTLLRHVIQIAPLLLAAAVAVRKPRWAACAAAPLFAFWLVVMAAIWLFLLGLARIVSGTFAPAEVALTIAIGVSCVLGLWIAHRRRTDVAVSARLGVIAVFAILQFAAMWVSTLPFVAR